MDDFLFHEGIKSYSCQGSCVCFDYNDGSSIRIQVNEKKIMYKENKDEEDIYCEWHKIKSEKEHQLYEKASIIVKHVNARGCIIY